MKINFILLSISKIFFCNAGIKKMGQQHISMYWSYLSFNVIWGMGEGKGEGETKKCYFFRTITTLIIPPPQFFWVFFFVSAFVLLDPSSMLERLVCPLFHYFTVLCLHKISLNIFLLYFPFLTIRYFSILCDSLLFSHNFWEHLYPICNIIWSVAVEE